jgi:SAM-dependent methyltransferase
MRKIVLGGHWCSLLYPWEIFTEHDIDITKPLPFIDDSIDFIFTEHVVEHIEIIEAIGFFKECYRVLKKGSIVRTVMPFVDVIVNRPYGNQWRKYFENNISHLIEKELKQLKDIELGIQDYADVLQINALFYKCGHKFLWDTQLLYDLLNHIGFNVKDYYDGDGAIKENCIEHKQRGIDMSMDYEKNMKCKEFIDHEGAAVEGTK